MKPIRISVLLPFHHEGSLLEEAIESVRRQHCNEWEMILVDSHADDRTRSIAARYTLSDPRIRMVLANAPGISAALNTGLSECAGAYIARMDADDRMHPERLLKQADFLDSHASIDLVASRCTVFPGTPENEGYRLFVAWQNEIMTPEDHRRNRFIESPIAHPSVMFRRSLIDRYGGYRDDGVPEDYELWLRWMDAGVRISKLPEFLLEWRDHSGRLSRNHPDYSLDAFLRVKARYLASWLQQHLPGDRPLVVCGGSRNIRNKLEFLQGEGIRFDAYTDVVNRPGHPLRYIPVSELPTPGTAFFINLIAQRGIRDQIRQLFNDRGYREEIDFLMLA